MNMIAQTPVVESWAAMKKRHFQDRVKAIADLAATGLTMTEVADALGVSRSLVYDFNKKYALDIAFKDPGNNNGSRTKTYKRRLFLSRTGISLKMGAKTLGMTVPSLEDWSDRNEVEWGSNWK